MIVRIACSVNTNFKNRSKAQVAYCVNCIVANTLTLHIDCKTIVHNTHKVFFMICRTEQKEDIVQYNMYMAHLVHLSLHRHFLHCLCETCR